TNEVADVSVVEASDHVFSCPCTHGCVLTATIVIEERRTANCRVVVRGAGSAEVIKRERDITNGGGRSGDGINDKRGRANSVVAGIVVIKERLKTEGGVVVGSGGRGYGEIIKQQRVGSNGRVVVGSDVEQHGSRAGCSIGIPIVEVQRSRADSGIEKGVRYEPSRVPPKPGIEPA